MLLGARSTCGCSRSKEVDGKWEQPSRGAKPPEGKTWVDEGYRPLTEVINEKHENVIYLPGIALPTSIVACPTSRRRSPARR